MKGITIGALALLLTAGCATSLRGKQVTSASEKRKLAMQQCIKDMMEADSSPSDALSICEVVYEKQGTTIKR
jgi:hypothetical protein